MIRLGLRENAAQFSLLVNECAGYVAVAGAALITGWIAARTGLRPGPFYPGIAFVVTGLGLSALLVRETSSHVTLESQSDRSTADVPSATDVFWRTTWTDRNLSTISQAGLVNNLNDGMVWGLFPLFFAGANVSLARIGVLAAIYSATWGIGQLMTGRSPIGSAESGWSLAGCGRRPLALVSSLCRPPLVVSPRARRCLELAPRWCIRRCLRRLEMWRYRHGVRQQSGSIGCGGIWAMPSARCSPV
jgi:hypothetical protein